MNNIPVGDIKPKDDEDDVQVINQPSSSNIPQDGEKDEWKMKILISPMSKWWYKHKMLMLHNLLLKWSTEEIYLSYKIIHKISS